MSVLNPVVNVSEERVGYSFNCPGCKRVHYVQTVPYDGHDTWSFNGDLDKPTFTPSILSKFRHPQGYSNSNPAPIGYDGPFVTDICHSFVTDGQIQFLGDCTHELANQTVPLKEWNGWDEP